MTFGPAARPGIMRESLCSSYSVQTAQDLPPERPLKVSAVAELVDASDQPPRRDALHVRIANLQADRLCDQLTPNRLERTVVEP